MCAPILLNPDFSIAFVPLRAIVLPNPLVALITAVAA